MKIIENVYKWNGVFEARIETKNIIIHHRAGNGDAESIHSLHLNQGCTGIGYHFYVRKDGTVYRGRPINTVGAHCIGKNDISIGICFEGNFEKEKMPAEQLKAGRELVLYLKGLYPDAEVKRHMDFYTTACPGKNFPFKEMNEEKKLTSANDIIWELMNGKCKVEITEVQRAVKALEKAKKENSSLYWILYKLANE